MVAAPGEGPGAADTALDCSSATAGNVHAASTAPEAMLAAPPLSPVAPSDSISHLQSAQAPAAPPPLPPAAPSSPVPLDTSLSALRHLAGHLAEQGHEASSLPLSDLSTLPRVEPRLGGDVPLVLLFVLTLSAPAAFILPAGGADHLQSFGAVDSAGSSTAGALRKSAMKLAGGWLSAALGPLWWLQSLLVGDTSTGDRVVVTPVRVTPPRGEVITTPEDAVYRRALAPPGTLLFFTLAALAGTALHAPASAAMAKCVSLIRPAEDLDIGNLRTGAMTLRPVIPHSAVSDDGTGLSVADALEACRQADALLRLHLDVPTDHPEYQFLHDSIDRVGGCDLSELYSEDELLASRAPGFGSSDLALAKFSHVIEPPFTYYSDRPGEGATKPSRQADHCYEVTFSSPPELLEDWCLRDLQDWLVLLEQDMILIAEGAYEDRQERPQPFIVGQDCFRPKARGCVWDLRRAAEGIIEPLDFSSQLHSQLDVDYVESALPEWADQRLIAYLRGGAHFEFDMPLQTVFHPHLYSVWHGFSSLQKEARRLQGTSYETQWSEIFPRVPFMPMWLLAHGSTPRKLEPDRYRSTTEGGAPRGEAYDTEGVPVRSINDRSREYPHPEERKPTPAAWAQDLAVLNSGTAQAITRCTSSVASTERPPGLYAVFQGTDDVADYFMHIATAPELWWYSTYAVLAREGDADLDIGSRLRFVVEYSLSFGVVCSSGYAQRLSTLIEALAERELQLLLDEEWPDWRLDLCYADWLSLRERMLGRQHARLHSIKMYTDDAALGASSIRMFIFLLRAWHRATSKLKLRMAIAAKRFLGTTIVWLGVGFISVAGILFIPKNKLLRAVQALRKAKGFRLTVQLMLSLLGLLEHLRGVLFGPRRWMFGLWALVADRQHPAAVVEPDGFAQGNLSRWIERLLQGGTVSALSAFARRAVGGDDAGQGELPLSPIRMCLHLWPDAARQRLVVDRRGLGAWCHGFIFCIPIAALGMQLLPISVLELLAALVALLTFSTLAPGAPIRLHTDSLTSFYVVSDETGRAPEGQYALDHFHSLPEAQGLRELTSIDHTYGEGNVGDLPSRAKWRELHALAAQLGARVRNIVVPPHALKLVRETLRFAGERQGASRDRVAILCQETVQTFASADPVVGTHSASFLNQEAHERPSALERAKLTLAAFGTVSPAPPKVELVDVHSLPSASSCERAAALLAPAQPKRAHSALEPAANATLPGHVGAREQAAAALSRDQTAPTPKRKAPAGAPRLDLAARSLGSSTLGSSTVAGPSASAAPIGEGPIALGSLQGSDRVTLADLQAQRDSKGRRGDGLGKGEYALRPSDASVISRMRGELRGLHADAQNERTTEKDIGHWNQYWEPICRLFSTRSIRDAPGAATGTDVEAQEADVTLFCFAFILIMATMKPKKRGAPAPQPQSGFQVLLAVVRIHKLLGLMTVPLKYVRLAMRGLLRRFVREHGHDALVPDRKWPMSHRILLLLLSLTSVPMGATVWLADSLLGNSTLAMICLLYASGFRKAEITCHGVGVSYLTRSSLQWVMGSTSYTDPPASLLRNPQPGYYVNVFPRQSKCDFTGEIWGDKPTVHHWSPAPGNAFAALAKLELNYPVHGHERATFPLFSENDGTPVSETRASRLLDAMLKIILGAALATHYTWHSFRHGLATRLRKAGCPADIIMQLCRWQTLQSLRTYARLDASQQLSWQDASFNASFTEGASAEALDSAPILAQLHDDETWDVDPNSQTRQPRTAQQRTPPRAASGSVPNLPPLDRGNAPRRIVLVPQTRYPRQACHEHNGLGWEAQVVSATGITALVRYLYARAADGRPYEDTREPLAVLQPIT